MKTGSINTFNGWSRGWIRTTEKILFFLLSLFIPIYICAEENAGIPNAFLGDRDGILVPVLLLLVASLLVIIAGLAFHLRRQKRKLRKSHEYLVRYITSNLELKKQVPGVKEPYPFYPPELTPEEFTKVIDNMLRRVMFLSLFTLLLTGCAKDDDYNTSHPDKGAVMVTADWSGRSSDATVPGTYVLRIGEREQTVNGQTNAFKELFLPGKQNLLILHQPEGVTVSGTIVTVSTLSDNTLEPMPGYLFSGRKELEIIADDTLRVTVPMQQHIRNLTLTLKLNPGDRERIRATSATLTGIASAVDLTTGAIISTNGKTVVPTFAFGTDKTARATGQPILVATLRLLGVTTEDKQIMTLDINLTDDTVHTITTDLTESLKAFGTGAEMEPLTLGTTLELPAEAGLTATIDDWNVVNNGNIHVK